MPSTSLDPNEILHALRGIGESVDSRNYSTLAALIFLVLDYIWLMPNELKFVWLSPPYRLCEALYILSRYLPIAVQTTSYVFVQRYLVHHPVSTVHCKVWFSLLGTTTDILSAVMDIILLLRVYALYKKKTHVVFFATLFAIKHVLALILIGKIAFGSEPSFNEYCDLNKTSIIALLVGVFTFLSQIGVWFAIFHKRKVSEGALLSTVVKESNWTCVLIIVPTVVMLAWSFYARPNQFMIFVWPITFISITLCHILLKVSQLKAKIARLVGRGPLAASTTDFLFSTILEFEGPGHDLETRASEIISASGRHLSPHAEPTDSHGPEAGAGFSIDIALAQMQSDSKPKA